MKRNKKENEDQTGVFYRGFPCFSVQNYLKVNKPVVYSFKLELISKKIIFHLKSLKNRAYFLLVQAPK